MRFLLMAAAGCAVSLAVEPDALIRRIASYESGGDPAAVRELEAMAYRAAGSAGAAAIEKLLIAGLDKAATLSAKDAFCRDLAIVGGDASVPGLAAMLLEPVTAEMARYALEKIPGTLSTAALRDALNRTSPPVQTGIVVSLGRRKDAGSVAIIKPLLSSKDARLAETAADALGKIGTPEAIDALEHAPASSAVSAALLQIAERADPAKASALYRRLSVPEHSEAVRVAALQGYARLAPRQAVPLLRAALKSDSALLEGAAIRLLARIEGAALANEIVGTSDRVRVRLISALADSGQPDVLPVVLQGAASDSAAVRAVALTALAKVGTAAEIPLLAGRAAAGDAEEQAAARSALAAIRGDAADAAILQAMPGADAKVKVELIRAAGERGIAAAVGALLAAASDSNRAVRIASLRALRETAGAPQIPALLALLRGTADSDRRELERTAAAAIRRSNGTPVGDVISAYEANSDPGIRLSLLTILSSAGNSAAMPLIRNTLRDPEPSLQRGALNALAAWPTPEPMDDLLALARTAADPARRILALRGYIQLVQLPSNRAPSETARLLRIAMAAAARPEEKKTILSVAQRVVCQESLQLVQAAGADPQIAAEAKQAETALERELAFIR